MKFGLIRGNEEQLKTGMFRLALQMINAMKDKLEGAKVEAQDIKRLLE